MMYDTCPNCGSSLDEVDYKYQICSRCNWSKEDIPPMPDDLPSADDIIRSTKIMCRCCASHKRSCMRMNDVDLCFDCVVFIYQTRDKNSTIFQALDKQTAYLNSLSKP